MMNDEWRLQFGGLFWMTEPTYNDYSHAITIFYVLHENMIFFFYQLLAKIKLRQLNSFCNWSRCFQVPSGNRNRCSTIILKLYPKTGSEYCFLLIYYQCYTCTLIKTFNTIISLTPCQLHDSLLMNLLIKWNTSHLAYQWWVA